MKYLFTYLTLAILVIEIVLWRTQVITGTVALLTILIAEFVIFCAALSLTWRKARATGIPMTSLIPPLHLIVFEAQLFQDLWRGIRHQIKIPPNAQALHATKGLWTLPCALSAATAIEIIAIELLLPWQIARIILLIVSIYSLLWLWAIFMQRAIYPHYLTNDALVLRRGRRVVLKLERSCITAASLERNFDSDPHLIAQKTLTIASTEGTNFTIHCLPVKAPPFSWPWQKASPENVTQVRLWLDQPQLLKEEL